MLTRRSAILVGLETTYGTDPALSNSVNGVMAWDIDLDIGGEILKREYLRDSLSPIPHVIGMKDVTLTFKTELKGVGTGTAGTNPETNLLTGCGFGTAALSGTGNTYSLVSAEAAVNSLSFLVYKDGNLHKVVGARGTPKLTLEAGKYGIWEWKFQGLYSAVQASTIPSLSGLPTTKPPIVYGASFQIGGFSPVCSKAEIDLANTLTRNESLNAASGVNSFTITNREPKMNFDADAVVESSNPFWGDWVGNVADTYSIRIGTAAGNTVNISGYFEYTKPKYGDKDGTSKYECEAALVTSDASGTNQEITIQYS
jgi:hypothetical protein